MATISIEPDLASQVTTTVVSATVDSKTVKVEPAVSNVDVAARRRGVVDARLHRWSHQAAVPFLLLLLGGMFLAVRLLEPAHAWVAVLVCLALFLGAAGKISGGRMVSALIDERNLMSLSRTQAVVWTMLILSGYFVMALVRMKHGEAAPLNVAIDSKLWILMGISVTSLIGTPFLLSDKRKKDPADQAIDKASAALKEPPAQIDADRQGTLYANASAADARLTDLFQGEEVGNTAYIELSKIQMFLFTLIAAAVFASQLWNQFANVTTADLSHMPQLPEGLIALLGISHAGYLGNKSVDHTPVQ